MKRIEFYSATGPDALMPGKLSEFNFDELDAEELLNNEHYVTREAIKSAARRADNKGQRNNKTSSKAVRPK